MTNLAAAVDLSRERVIETVKHLQTTVRMFGEVRLSKDCGPFIDSLLAILQAETTRPPVAGLAELTDEQIMAFWQAMNNASKFFCSNNYAPLVNWAASHERAVLTAARAYLAALPKAGDTGLIRLGSVDEAGVYWEGKNPHQQPIGTVIYAAPPQPKGDRYGH